MKWKARIALWEAFIGERGRMEAVEMRGAVMTGLLLMPPLIKTLGPIQEQRSFQRLIFVSAVTLINTTQSAPSRLGPLTPLSANLGYKIIDN